MRNQRYQVADLPCKAVEMVVEIDLSVETGSDAMPDYQLVKPET